jgi:tRNA threonylcarbamoyladenosine biosynthesis protein TsaB
VAVGNGNDYPPDAFALQAQKVRQRIMILAFDTTVAAVSVALWRDGAILAHRQEVMDQGQAEALMPLVETIMKEAHAAYGELSRIAVTVGPGSFTGVRVGLAAARGLGLAAGKSVIGVLTTEVLAAAVTAEERGGACTGILAAIDTKRGDLYVQLFDSHGRAAGLPCVVAPTDLAAWAGANPLVVVGDAAAIAVSAIGASARLSVAPALPDMGVLAKLAAGRAPQDGGPMPVYVRAPDAVVPAQGGRLRL